MADLGAIAHRGPGCIAREIDGPHARPRHHEASSAPVRHGAGLKPGTKPIGSMRLIAKVPAKESQRHSGWVLIEVFFVVVRSFPPRIAVVSGSVRRCAGAFMRRFDDETFKPA